MKGNEITGRWNSRRVTLPLSMMGMGFFVIPWVSDGPAITLESMLMQGVGLVLALTFLFLPRSYQFRFDLKEGRYEVHETQFPGRVVARLEGTFSRQHHAVVIKRRSFPQTYDLMLEYDGESIRLCRAFMTEGSSPLKELQDSAALLNEAFGASEHRE